MSLHLTLITMTEPSHDPDGSYDNVGEDIGMTGSLLVEENGPEVSRGLLYILVLTCGGAG